MLLGPAATLVDRGHQAPKLPASDWESATLDSDWLPSVAFAAGQELTTYLNGDAIAIDTFVAELTPDAPGLAGFAEPLVGEAWFALAGERVVTEDYVELVMRDHYSERRRVLRYWLQIGDTRITREADRRRTQTLARIAGYRASYLVATSTACVEQGCVSARQQLDAAWPLP